MILLFLNRHETQRDCPIVTEFLIERLMQNGLINIDLERNTGVRDEHDLENLYGEEVDPALGNVALKTGRLFSGLSALF